MATIIIPTPLRKYTNNNSRVQISAGANSVQQAVEELIAAYPDLKKHLLDEQGKLRSFINLFVGDSDIRDLQHEETRLAADAIVSIVPAIAGGTEESVQFSKEELARYNRHIIIPDFGLEAQRKLKAAKVLVIGSGGLGSPLLLYLTAAGVGTIGIVDFDVVDDSNLQRQVLFGIDEIGKPKVEAAKARLQALNPFIKINTYNTRLTSKNALEILKDYDVVADGTDNFPTRYLVNDAAVLLGKPNVYASIFQFEGQVAVFNYRNKAGELGPNYRDLYPTPPPPGLVPNCAEAGVLGVLPGIIGSLQGLEVIKIITGIGEPLSGRFYTFDALTFESRTFKIKRNPHNPINGTNPTIRELIDYEEFCGLNIPQQQTVKEITAKELYLLQTKGEDIQLIDVREQHEYDIVNIGAELIPLATVPENVHRISRSKKVIVHCKSGRRSARAIEQLQEQYNFDNLYNLKGGILEWINAIQPELTRY